MAKIEVVIISIGPIKISGLGQQVVVPEKSVTLYVCRHLQNASAPRTQLI